MSPARAWTPATRRPDNSESSRQEAQGESTNDAHCAVSPSGACPTLRRAATPWATTSAPLPKFLLAFPSKVPHQPVRVEGVLGGHAPAHDGVQKGLPLAGIEAQHLREQGVGWGSREFRDREKGIWRGGGREEHREGRGLQLGQDPEGRAQTQGLSWPHLYTAVTVGKPLALLPPPLFHTPEVYRGELFALRRGQGNWGRGVQAGPTSILPPTRARRGGRGLSLSLFSCLLDCRRPPGK